MLYPVKLIDYGWLPRYGVSNFAARPEHPLFCRSLVTLTLKFRVFNRAEEKFTAKKKAVNPCRVATVELSRSHHLLVKLFADLDQKGRKIDMMEGYLEPGDYWEIALWSPEGQRVGTISSDDYPLPPQNGKAA